MADKVVYCTLCILHRFKYLNNYHYNDYSTETYLKNVRYILTKYK